MPAEQLPQRRILTGRHANDQPVIVHASLLRWEDDRFTKSTKNLRRTPAVLDWQLTTRTACMTGPGSARIPAFSKPLTTHELP
jgi:hypothetical protein